MNKIKELVFLQLILAVLILLLTFLNDLAGSKINEFSRTRIINGNMLNSQRLEVIDNKLDETKFELYAMLGTPPIGMKSQSLDRVTAIQLKINEVKGCDSINRLERIECTNQIIALISEENTRLKNEYNKDVSIENEKLKVGTPWSSRQDFLTFFQIILGLCLIFINHGLGKRNPTETLS